MLYTNKNEITIDVDIMLKSEGQPIPIYLQRTIYYESLSFEKTYNEFVRDIIRNNFSDQKNINYAQITGIIIENAGIKFVTLNGCHCHQKLGSKLHDLDHFNLYVILYYSNIMLQSYKQLNSENFINFLSEIIKSDHNAKSLYLIITGSANIVPAINKKDIIKHIHQGIDLNAVKFAKQNKYKLILFLTDIEFINTEPENVQSISYFNEKEEMQSKNIFKHIQTTGYLDMIPIKIQTYTQYFECIKYTLNEKPLKYNKSFFNIDREAYHAKLEEVLGIDWFNILQEISFTIYTIGIDNRNLCNFPEKTVLDIINKFIDNPISNRIMEDYKQKYKDESPMVIYKTWADNIEIDNYNYMKLNDNRIWTSRINL